MTDPTPGIQPGMDPRAAAKAAKAYAKATRPWYRKKRWWILAAVVVIAVVAGVSSGGGSSSSTKQQVEDAGTVATAGPSTSASAAKSKTSSPGKPSFANGVLTTDDVGIVITKYKILPPGVGGNDYGHKTLIAFWCKITNLSGAKTSPVMETAEDFSAYQDNNPNRENQLEVGELPDDKYLNTQEDNIKKGGTVGYAFSFELDDLTTPVELVASDDLGFSTLGKMTYPVK